MTYRDLLTHIQNMDAEQLDQTVTVSNGPVDNEDTEFFGAVDTGITGEEADVLDPGHFVIVCDF
jgi:hypothetical protein